MKKIIIIIFNIILLSTSYSQEGWYWLNPSPEGNSFNAVTLFGNNNAVAVGNVGVIFRSSDNGANWTKVKSGVSDRLWDVAIAGNGIGWAVGENGAVLKTSDGGLNWVKQNVAFNYMYAIATDGNKCFIGASSGRVYISLNGGTTWTTAITPSTRTIQAIYYQGSGVVYTAHTGGVILKSLDDGTTWTTLTTNTTRDLNDIKFSGSIGIAVGDLGTIIRTTDGGNTWTNINSSKTSNLVAVGFLDANNVFVIDGIGSLLKSTNGGVSFTSPSMSTLARLSGNNAMAIKSGLMLIVGDYGLIQRSFDNGLTWSDETKGITTHLTDVWFTSTTTGFACGEEGNIYKSIDGGVSWANKTSGLLSGFRSFHFVNQSLGYAVGMVIIVRTTNGGESWSTLLSDKTNPALTDDIYSIYFLNEPNANFGWACGGKGKIYSTANGGQTWTSLTSGTTQTLCDIKFVDQNRGMAIGWNGTVITTTDGGASWINRNSGFTEILYSLHLFDAQNAIACGSNGKVIKTTNGGISWNSIAVPDDANYNHLYRMRFTNSNVGWFVGSFGAIYKTTNGGNTWVNQNSKALNDLLSVFPVNENVVYAVGPGGTVLKTTNGGGIVSFKEKSEIPLNIILHQNYPNPFNPTTVISYQLSVNSWVTLKVYDVLGKEVKTLVNENKEPGRYVETFHGTSLPSGIYFYRLTVSNPLSGSGEVYSQTRKMILIK